MGDWFIGEIRLFSMSWNPQYWLPCDGRILQTQQYQALFALLGKTYGGNGTTTFALPDLRGRTPVGVSQTDRTYQSGTVGGAETVVLNTTQIPPHIHTFSANSASGTSTMVSAGAAIATVAASPQMPTAPSIFIAPAANQPMIPLNPATVGNAGSSAGHPNMQPSLTLNFCIACAGLYPPRN